MMANDDLANRASEAGAAAGGPAEGDLDTDATLTEEQRLEVRRRRALATAVDDADASHEGGLGAQGGAADFGNPKNFGLPQ
jgi:hypothetical protein